MATMRLRYVHSFVDKTGRVRSYFGQKGKRWPLPGEPGSTEFAARYDELRRDCITAAGQGECCLRPEYLGRCDREVDCKRRLHIKGASHPTPISADTRPDQRDWRPRPDQRSPRRTRPRNPVQFLPATVPADEAVMLLSMLWQFTKEHLAMRLGPNPTTDVKKNCTGSHGLTSHGQ
jgi:hypothetical protein